MENQRLAGQLRLFKTLTIITVVLLLAAIVYGYQRRNAGYYLDQNGNPIQITQEMLDELFEVNDVLNIAEQPLTEKGATATARIDSVLTGRRIPVARAISKTDSFITWNKRKFNLVREITPYGFAFGKHRMRKMLMAIDSVNRILTAKGDTENLIYGVRAYLTLSKNHLAKNDRHLDLLFVPITKDGNNYIPLTPSAKKAISLGDEGNLMLNTSAPCPNVCGEW